MRDERTHIMQVNGINGPLLVGACGGGIPVAMVPVVPVGAMNGTEQGTQATMPPVVNLGNGSQDCKYDDKKRINSSQGPQNKSMARKLPTNGAQRMVLILEYFNQ
ncbi:uncharacterized protein LOC118203371 isoform X2 [Stegodyphus dumicola]|uniref:uncharacterized protein LOC118203371 isoform X2 n=1 Tax=Stegodyphus dumicola TaxID=202533 RepID=UPI0015A7E7E1|nr:uncharacterized protein LOC118203371 isoform X2 [Stegodyphus dumicola]